MSMTNAQAKELGRLIAKIRAKKGQSTRALAAKTGLGVTWIAELEAGKYLEPAPERLARLAEALDIEPRRIDRLTKGAMVEGLPGARAYFRAKFDLSPDEAAKVERYIERLRKAA